MLSRLAGGLCPCTSGVSALLLAMLSKNSRFSRTLLLLRSSSYLELTGCDVVAASALQLSILFLFSVPSFLPSFIADFVLLHLRVLRSLCGSTSCFSLRDSFNCPIASFTFSSRFTIFICTCDFTSLNSSFTSFISSAPGLYTHKFALL